MSENENIEKAVQTEESPETKGAKTTVPAATDNVVLYPVSDEKKNVSAAQATSDTESAASEEISATQSTDNPTAATASEQPTDTKTTDSKTADTKTTDNKTTDSKTADSTDKFSGTRNTKESSKTDVHRSSNYEKNVDDDDDLEEDFYEQQENSRSKDEHPFREFFSNFRSKRKIEMNRDEQILSRISDEDLMEYLRMEQKRMELLQQAKEVREKRFWTTFQLFICLLSIILVIYFLKDNPVILVTILYTVGILAALHIWSKSQNGRDHRDNKDFSDHHKKPWE